MCVCVVEVWVAGGERHKNSNTKSREPCYENLPDGSFFYSEHLNYRVEVILGYLFALLTFCFVLLTRVLFIL